MDFELITNYDVSKITKFLNDNPDLWNIEPEENVHNSPNYKSLRKNDLQKLDSLLTNIVCDLEKRFNGKRHQQSISLLPSGEDIREHSDQVGGLKRFHIPLITNTDVIFYCGNSAINMKVGECWMFDYKKQHKVLNNGNTDRIHLMVDLSDE